MEGKRETPALENLEIVLLFRLEVQAFPEPSIAMELGLSNPPLAYPGGADRAAPALENSEMLLLP